MSNTTFAAGCRVPAVAHAVIEARRQVHHLARFDEQSLHTGQISSLSTSKSEVTRQKSAEVGWRVTSARVTADVDFGAA